MNARPLVKWQGGKGSLLPTLLEHVPEKIKSYYEPFVGGGALFWALKNQNAIRGDVFLNDINVWLMVTYEAVRDVPQQVIKKLLEYKQHFQDAKDQEAFYYEMRKIQRTDIIKASPPVRAAWFLFMNRLCFNGIWRVNRLGQFNVPFGDYANPTICDEDNILACSRGLKGAFLLKDDFTMACRAKKGDFVYFDPPYLPRTKNFTKYHENDFGLQEHTQLRDLARLLKKKGVHVLISNSGATEVYDLYKGRDFKIIEVQGRRSSGATVERRGYMPDVLIK